MSGLFTGQDRVATQQRCTDPSTGIGAGKVGLPANAAPGAHEWGGVAVRCGPRERSAVLRWDWREGGSGAGSQGVGAA